MRETEAEAETELEEEEGTDDEEDEAGAVLLSVELGMGMRLELLELDEDGIVEVGRYSGLGRLSTTEEGCNWKVGWVGCSFRCTLKAG